MVEVMIRECAIINLRGTVSMESSPASHFVIHQTMSEASQKAATTGNPSFLHQFFAAAISGLIAARDANLAIPYLLI